jgi:hypothetical protein
VDGRTDLFGDEIIGEWIKLVNGESGWEEALESRNIRLILLAPDRPLAQHLGQARNWELVYEDGKAVVYRQISGSVQ